MTHRTRSTRFVRTISWTSVLCALATLPAFAATPECKPELVSSTDAEYQWRGGFCEGLCSEDVSAAVLDLGSFDWRPTAAAFAPDEVTLHWHAPPETKRVLLTIRSLDPLRCYRLDAVPPAKPGSFVWPTGVARALGLLPEQVGTSGVDGAAATEMLPPDLGVLLRAEMDDGSTIRLPVRIGDEAGALRAVIVPGSDLSMLGYTMRRFPVGSAPDVEGRVARSYIPAGDPVDVELPCPVAGRWHLELGALPGPRSDAGPMTRGLHLGLDCGFVTDPDGPPPDADGTSPDLTRERLEDGHESQADAAEETDEADEESKP